MLNCLKYININTFNHFVSRRSTDVLTKPSYIRSGVSKLNVLPYPTVIMVIFYMHLTDMYLLFKKETEMSPLHAY